MLSRKRARTQLLLSVVFFFYPLGNKLKVGKRNFVECMAYLVDWKWGFGPLSFIYMKKNDYDTHLILTFTSENDLVPPGPVYRSIQKTKPAALIESSTS